MWEPGFKWPHLHGIRVSSSCLRVKTLFLHHSSLSFLLLHYWILHFVVLFALGPHENNKNTQTPCAERTKNIYGSNPGAAWCAVTVHGCTFTKQALKSKAAHMHRVTSLSCGTNNWSSVEVRNPRTFTFKSKTNWTLVLFGLEDWSQTRIVIMTLHTGLNTKSKQMIFTDKRVTKLSRWNRRNHYECYLFTRNESENKRGFPQSTHENILSSSKREHVALPEAHSLNNALTCSEVT